MTVKTVRRTTTTTTITITEARLRAALTLPDEAVLQFRVPGGGDWSNTDLDIDEHLTATWSTTEEVET